MNKQKVTRELQAANKTIAALDIATSQFKSDSSSMSVSEWVALKKKVAARLESNVEFVYIGEDLEGDNGEIANKEELNDRCEKRKVFTKGDVQTDAMHCTAKSLLASKSKDPDSYAPGALKASIGDCSDCGITVSTCVLKTYMTRAVYSGLEEAALQFTDSWLAVSDGLADPTFHGTVDSYLPHDVFSDVSRLVSTSEEPTAGQKDITLSQESVRDAETVGIGFLAKFVSSKVCGDIQWDSFQYILSLVLEWELFIPPPDPEVGDAMDTRTPRFGDFDDENCDAHVVENIEQANRFLLCSLLAAFVRIEFVEGVQGGPEAKAILKVLAALALADENTELSTMSEQMDQVCKQTHVLSKYVNTRLVKQLIDRY